MKYLSVVYKSFIKLSDETYCLTPTDLWTNIDLVASFLDLNQSVVT